MGANGAGWTVLVQTCLDLEHRVSGYHRVKHGCPTLAQELRIVEEAFGFLSPEDARECWENAARDPGVEVSAFDLLKDGPEVELPVRR